MNGGMKDLPPPPRLTLWVPALAGAVLSALWLILTALI